MSACGRQYNLVGCAAWAAGGEAERGRPTLGCKDLCPASFSPPQISGLSSLPSAFSELVEVPNHTQSQVEPPTAVLLWVCQQQILGFELIGYELKHPGADSSVLCSSELFRQPVQFQYHVRTRGCWCLSWCTSSPSGSGQGLLFRLQELARIPTLLERDEVNRKAVYHPSWHLSKRMLLVFAPHWRRSKFERNAG